jgi:acetate CoA/acetoacetate CoA-transferase beta subunit
VVDLIVTDLGVMEVSKAGLVLKEIAPGMTPEQVQELTEARLIIPKDLKNVEV